MALARPCRDAQGATREDTRNPGGARRACCLGGTGDRSGRRLRTPEPRPRSLVALGRSVCRPEAQSTPGLARHAMTRELTFLEAVREAQVEEMQRDENVLMMGQDLRASLYGGAGLVELFGEE